MRKLFIALLLLLSAGVKAQEFDFECISIPTIPDTIDGSLNGTPVTWFTDETTVHRITYTTQQGIIGYNHWHIDGGNAYARSLNLSNGYYIIRRTSDGLWGLFNVSASPQPWFRMSRSGIENTSDHLVLDGTTGNIELWKLETQE